jgi:glycosyltransferase involved in cell wall biosynthesis
MNLTRATMLLISYNQEAFIELALQGAVDQDYANLEIIVSDDASSDLTFSKIQAFVASYDGPHIIVINRNEKNIGIGANLSKAVSLSSGEIFFITAGDDISISNRVSFVMDFWIENNKMPDLIACNLFDMLQDGSIVSEIYISDLALYRSMEDWIKSPPIVIGAAQAWTRRLYDHFGGIPDGVVGEDMVMAFRATALSRAVTLPVALVKYRRGGLTSKVKAFSANDVIRGLTRNIESSQVEYQTIIKDALYLGAGMEVLSFFKSKFARAAYVKKMFYSNYKIYCFLNSPDVDFGFRCRIFIYAVLPWVTAPLFFVKKIKYRNIT